MTDVRKDGVDLSHFQAGALDFRAAKKAGLKFVVHKATEGTSFVDPIHNMRRPQVKGASLRFGSYHFARPSASGGAAQAHHFLSVAKPQKDELWPMLDLEDQGGLSQAALTDWVGDFLKVIQDELGCKMFIYTRFNLNRHFDCPLWRARYSDAMLEPVIPTPWDTYTIWQFSDGIWPHNSPLNQVTGIGHCDIDFVHAKDPISVLDKFMVGARPQPPKVKKQWQIVAVDRKTHKVVKILAERKHLVGMLADKGTREAIKAARKKGLRIRIRKHA